MFDMQQLKDALKNEKIKKAVISNPFKKGENEPFKILIELIILKGKKCYQFSYYIDKKVVHKNIAFEDVSDKIINEMVNKFKQCLVISDYEINILMNKHNQFHIKKKAITNQKEMDFSHNKQKNYILKDGEPVKWAIMAGLMADDGKILSHKQKKFRQINKFLEMLSDIEDKLPMNAVIADMGCGKSYLTFAMYYYFNIIKNKNVTIRGFDLKADVVENCNKIAKELEFGNLSFEAGDIANITSQEKINMLITLHACDTATDIALYHAVRLNCDVIMSVPCCQHELFGQIENELLKPIFSYGILKERFASLLTDGVRANVLELCGYKVNVEEFIETEHTPKNIMIKAIKTGKKANPQKHLAVNNIISEFSITPTIYKLLKDYIK